MFWRQIRAQLAGRGPGDQQRRVTATAAIVVAVHFLRYAGPLIYVPLVVRLLPVDEAGSFFRYQSLGFLLALFVEFGLSGTALRDWVRQEGPLEKSSLFNRLMAERMGNAAAIAAIYVLAVFVGGANVTDLLVIIPFAIAAGSNMTWYFMASGRPVVGSATEALTQAVGIALLLAAMMTTASAVWSMVALTVGQLANVSYGLWAAHRDGVALRPGISLSGRSKLRQLPMFIVRIGSMISSAGSPWVVATLGGVVQAGLYGPSARLFGAIGATMSPLGDVLIPLISRRVRTVERYRALTIALGSSLAGIALAVVIYALAHPIAQFLYGDLGHLGIDLIRILALSVPFLFAWQALSLFVLIPAGRERMAAIAIVIGALTFLALAAFDRTAHGAALAKVAADVVSFLVMFASVILRKRSTADA